MKYYLYVKVSPLGLKYLGKTIKNPYEYSGSGKIWKRHLKKHGFTNDDIQTNIIFETDKLNDLIEQGIKFSIDNNIVESKEWANLRNECGDGGDTSKFIDYSNPNFHKSNRGKHLHIFTSEEDKKRIIAERTKKINYKDPERLRKIKENTDWESWKKSIKKRNTDYSKFLPEIQEMTKKPIIQLDLNDNVITEYDSATTASKKLNVGRSGIIQCLRKRNKTAFGYKWKYKN
jgi:hypothetical protein